MKLEDLVLTIEQAKYLQKLGLDMSDAALCWYQRFDRDWDVDTMSDGIRTILKEIKSHSTPTDIPTYTLQEVLDKLPKIIKDDAYEYRIKISYKSDDYYQISYCDYFGLVAEAFCGDKLLDVSYTMLCSIIENGYLKTNKTK